MIPTNGPPSEAERLQREVCNAFARAAVAMRDAALTAENFSNWLARVNDIKNISVPTFFPSPSASFPMYSGPQQQPYLIASPASADDTIAKTARKRKAGVEDVEEDGKKKRVTKEKKVRDKNAPKRPPSAYLLFQNDVRKEVKAANPSMANNEILKEIARMWADVPPEDKKEYEEGRQKIKVQYDIAKAQYDAEHPSGVIAENAEPKPKKPRAKAKSKNGVIEVTTPVELIPASEERREESEDASSDTDSSDDEDKADAGSRDDDDDEGEESEPEPPRKRPKTAMPPPPPPPPASTVKIGEKKKKKTSKSVDGEEKERSKKKKKNA